MNNRIRNIIIGIVLIGIFTSVYVMNVGFVRTRIAKKIQEQRDSMQPVLDKSITSKIEKEDGVEHGYVYVTANVAFAPIIVKDDMHKDKAKILVEKYIKILKRKYSDKEISVKAITNSGDALYQEDIEKED